MFQKILNNMILGHPVGDQVIPINKQCIEQFGELVTRCIGDTGCYSCSGGMMPWIAYSPSCCNVYRGGSNV